MRSVERARDVARRAVSALSFRRVGGSAGYWERRYRSGGTSGVGSYGPLAEFKARELNALVRELGVDSVAELGCGDGNQLALAEYPRYLGLDVSAAAIERCTARFADDATKSFMLYDPPRFADPAGFLRADLAMSLDVLFHLVEDATYESHLDDLFAMARRWVVVYSSDEELDDPAGHVRHRRFTPWVERHQPSWELLRRVDNPLRDTEVGAVADLYLYGRRAVGGGQGD